MLKLLTIVVAMTAASTASAEPDWNKVDSRAESTYRVANWGVLGGITASLVGGLSGETSVTAVGNIVYTGSMATAAGATLRQRRSIVERGVPTTAAWGYASWGLQIATLGLEVGSQIYIDQKGYNKSKKRGIDEEHRPAYMAMALGSLACSIGAILSSTAQHHENTYKRSLIGRSAAQEPTFYVSIQPTVGVDGEPGLAAIGFF